MRYCVTGGGGFIGSRLALALHARGHEVVAVDDLSGCLNWDNLEAATPLFGSMEYARLRRINLDVSDLQPVRRVLDTYGPFDCVVHAAANAREGASQFQPVSVCRRNLLAASSVLTAALDLGVRKFVVFSSMAVYGAQQPPFDESMPLRPVDVYGVNKAAMEQMLHVLCEVHGASYVVVRPHNCFDAETEILTRERGWVYFEDLTFDDAVATLNEERKLEWHRPTEIQRLPYTGKMRHLKGQGFDLKVTPDHHLYLSGKSKPHLDSFEVVRAEDVTDADYSRRLLTTCSWEGKDWTEKKLPAVLDSLGRADSRNPERVIAIEDWLRLFAWFTTEGSVYATPSNYTVKITKHDPAVRQEIADVITACGYAPYLTPDGRDVKVHSKQLYGELIKYAGASNKAIPTDIKNLPTQRLRILFDTLMRGDGNRTGEPRRYTTVSARLAGDVQEIAIKLGYRANVAKEYTVLNGRRHRVYRVAFSERTTPQIGCNYEKAVYLRDVDYDGMVYDCTVENHVILVRRNGKAVWSGNCFGEGQALHDRHRNVVGIFMNRIMRDEPLWIYGNGKQQRAFSYIGDCLPAFVRACEGVGDDPDLRGTVVNVGGRHPASINALAAAVVEAMGVDASYPVVYYEDRPREVREAYSTYSLSERLLRYDEAAGWQEGVRRMARWARGVGPVEWVNNEPMEIRSDLLPVPWREE